MSGSPSSYRDRIYIVKDVILKLVEYGELNQTALVSFCGLNLKKHKPILDDLEENGMIERKEEPFWEKNCSLLSANTKGRGILQGYLGTLRKGLSAKKG